MRKTALVLALVALTANVAHADATYFDLSSGNLTQDWTNIGLITTADDWAGVPSIQGFRGDTLTGATGTDPQTLLAADDPGVLDVNANQTNPNTNSSGGIAEFDTLTNPVVALQGSGTADAPYLKLYLNSSGRENLQLSFNARDVDGSTDNAVQQLAVHFRDSNTGLWTNVPAAYVPDATTGPSLADAVTPVSVTLPAAANNEPVLEVRIMTSNAASNDEWVGIDDIVVSSDPQGAPPTISIDDISGPEGTAVINSFSFTVSLSAPNPGPGNITVDFATANDTATNVGAVISGGFDYTGQSGTLIFTPGQSIQGVDVAISSDSTFEGDDTFFINLSNPVGATIADAQGLGTIQNDDPEPVINGVSTNVLEGDAGNTSVDVQIQLSNSSAFDCTFNVETFDTGSATDGVDYVNLAAVSRTFNPGETVLLQAVEAIGDTAVEGNETFELDIFGEPLNCMTGSNPTITILDDDAVVIPTVSINSVSVVETTGGTTLASFEVALSTPAGAGGVSVTATTSNGSAQAPGDYTANSQTVNFMSGQQVQSFNVVVVGDNVVETDETFTVTLSNPIGATLGTPIGTGTIQNDDSAVVSLGDGAQPEGDPPGGITGATGIRLSNPVQADVSFDFASAPISRPGEFAPTPGVDYVVPANGTRTISAGSIVTQVLFTTIGDTTVETVERVGVDISNLQVSVPALAGSISFGNTSGNFAILDDDSTGLTVMDATIAEGNSGTQTLNIPVSLANPSVFEIRVDYTTANGTASAGSDYVANSGTLIFTPGQTLQNISVTINGDTIVEADENFTVTLSNPVGAPIFDGSATATINNDDSSTFSVAAAQVLEGNSGTTALNFTATLTNAFQDAVSVNFQSVDGSATVADSDYQAASGSIDFAPGATTGNFVVNVVGDTKVEPNQTFQVNFSQPVSTPSLSILTPAVGTIQNDDSTALRIADASIVEGNSGTQNLVFTVTLSFPNKDPVTVQYATSDGSAVAPSDYTSRSGTLTFPSTVLTQTITVPIVGDLVVEGDEQFTVTLTGAVGAAIDDGVAVGTITNNDSAQLNIAANTVVEGNSGLTPMPFSVSLSRQVQGTVSFGYQTSDGSATIANNDYQAASGSLNFAQGTPSQGFAVNVVGDITTEPSEQFNVNLNNLVLPAGITAVSFAPAATRGTILNDDGSGFGVAPVTVVEGNAGTRVASFTVQLSNPNQDPVSVSYRTVDQTATAGSDYVARTGTLNFTPGQTQQTVDITINGDIVVETDESFRFELFDPVGSTLATSFALGTITNDDSTAVAIADVSLLEGNSGTTNFVFNVSLSAPSQLPVSVNYATANGTATTPADYASTSGVINFAPLSQAATVSVAVVGDIVCEADETFFVNLSNPLVATLADGQALGTIRNDDLSATTFTVPFPGGGAAQISGIVSGGGGCTTVVSARFLPLVGDPESPPRSVPDLAPDLAKNRIDPDVRFPFGLLSLSVAGATPGSQVTVDLAFPSNAASGGRWYAFGLQNGNQLWYLPAGATVATNSARVLLTDGGVGDHDGAIDGNLRHLGGAGIRVPVEPIPVFGPLGAGAAVLALGLIGALRLRRRKA